MQYVTDLHLHSRYSRAVSPQMTLPVMAKFAKQKGLDILTAADFTHPAWLKESSVLLEQTQDGIYTLRAESGLEKKTHFLLSTEISCIYKHGDKLRRIHNLVFAPTLETVAAINTALVKRGCNLHADGRPIIGLTSQNLLELILEIDERCFLIPCHVWTPHFGIYGSASGYDSLKEAFGDLTDYIYGVETGLSSDPDMNWSIKELKNRSILSFSDAHSPAKMGREATVMELATLSFDAIKEAIKRTSKENKIAYTIEFYPEEGKYHFSGHRNCKISYGPAEIREQGTTCPVCKKRMTEGVLYRVQQLADPAFLDRVEIHHDALGLKWYTDKQQQQPPYIKLVPLLEIAAESLHSTVASKKSQALFTTLCEKFGSEITVLLRTPLEQIEKAGGERVAEGVERVRKGTILIDPGYDGEYGHVTIWHEGEEKEKIKIPQLGFEF